MAIKNQFINPIFVLTISLAVYPRLAMISVNVPMVHIALLLKV